MTAKTLCFPCTVFMLVLAVTNCKTTSKDTSSTKAQSESSAPQPDSNNSPILPRSEAQSIYIKMLEVEMTKGAKIPQDKAHEITGYFACEQAGLMPCSYQIKFTEAELSPAQPSPSGINQILVQFAQKSRPDLKDSKNIKLDLTCTYIGKSSPPYTYEDVTCSPHSARLPTEALFSDRVAEELSESLRTTQTFGESQATLSGALQCQWISLSGRAVCTTRVNAGGMIAETIRELSPQTSEPLAKRLKETALALKQVEDASTMKSIAGLTTCFVDATPVKDGGLPKFHCRVDLR